MTGPLLLFATSGLIGLVVGAVDSGWPGAIGGLAAGLIIAAGIVAAVVAAATVWATQIGLALEREDALEQAPRPPGFGALCDRVYDRILGEENP